MLQCKKELGFPIWSSSHLEKDENDTKEREVCLQIHQRISNKSVHKELFAKHQFPEACNAVTKFMIVLA